ncbi:MAG TPA: penicillin-binding protein 1C [Steroidobacteraceae bacterium]|nr:penicillin-binding protein 1C [Steroidobacteraceae bacterium]
MVGVRRSLLGYQNAVAAVLLLAVVPAACRLWPRPPLRQLLPQSTAVYDDRGHLLRLTLAEDGQYRLWVPLEEISPQLVQAVLLHEDRWFYWHAGFNPYGLLRGAWVTYVRHGERQGGSTITMQLARLLWRLDTHAPSGKLLQLARAVQLEATHSKREILEAYLNAAPYGGNVEGIGAASLAYFGHLPSELTLPEALTLAVIPQDPARRLRLSRTAPLIGTALERARNRLFTEWLGRRPRDRALEPLFELPLTLRSVSQLPFEAPHAVDQVLAGERLEGRSPLAIRTTIDLDLQHLVEAQLRGYIARQRPVGIVNGAAILVDTRDMGIKAMVGSSDFFDASIDGQVNGTAAKRSPGSTLKPFIYALGFDQGVLHPQTVLRDVPTAFGPYEPENFDGHFLGPVTATEALIRSRNIPAVWVAAKLHQPDLYQFLEEAGIGGMASEEHYGLALVLGGGEVTMQELAGLYAMLADHGALRPLRLRALDPRTPGTPLLSDAASFLVMDILRQNPRPAEIVGSESGALPIYWKTGTSWAFRDAWTAGIVGPYVLVVWIGNFDGSGNPAFVGLQAAAPLFFQITDALRAAYPGLRAVPLTLPAGVKRVPICLASGELPNRWCPQVGWTWFIPGRSPIRVSNVHRPVVIDDATGEPACPPYSGKHTHVEVYEFWPSDLQQVFAEAGIPRRRPPHNSSCSGTGADGGDPPLIQSPVRGASYTLRLAAGAHERIALRAVADADAQSLYWFVDDAYLGRSTPGQALLWHPARTGRFTLRVVDDSGRSDERPVDVSLEP